MISRELKKGSTEILILSLLEEEERHGYAMGKAMVEQSGGVLKLNAASLYPILYRLEKKKWISGRWESTSGRRRRIYRLTAAGKKVLAEQRSSWRSFVDAIEKVARIRHA